jgi:autotransporter-associated beta strand protein
MHSPLRFLILPSLSLFLIPLTSKGGSATWDQTPASSDWDLATNWTPNTIPDAPTDVATFDASNQTMVTVSKTTHIGEIVFASDAPSYTLAVSARKVFDIAGGIDNESGTTQTISVQVGPGGIAGGLLYFRGKANADTATINANGAMNYIDSPGSAVFFDHSSAGKAALFALGEQASGYGGGSFGFSNRSTAGHSTISVTAGMSPGIGGGKVSFSGDSTAEDATITLTSSVGGQSRAGQVQFNENSNAANAKIRVAGEGGGEGSIQFFDSASGGRAEVTLVGTFYLDISSHNAPGVEIGSLAGTGFVYLGGNNLTIGSNNIDTVFAGRIEDEGINGRTTGGSLTKVGRGSLELKGINIYNGGTLVTGGTLRVSNAPGGSATGKGPVKVAGGTLGGDGFIKGNVTMGTGSGSGATLEPGTHAVQEAQMSALTIGGPLAFETDAMFTCRLDIDTAAADEVIANGVTIAGAAKFNLSAYGSGALEPGTVFTIIGNTASTPISGTFANLPDGAIVTAGGNNLQASYEGGDGNDLTLTVVP